VRYREVDVSLVNKTDHLRSKLKIGDVETSLELAKDIVQALTEEKDNPRLKVIDYAVELKDEIAALIAANDAENANNPAGDGLLAPTRVAVTFTKDQPIITEGQVLQALSDEYLHSQLSYLVFSNLEIDGVAEDGTGPDHRWTEIVPPSRRHRELTAVVVEAVSEFMNEDRRDCADKIAAACFPDLHAALKKLIRRAEELRVGK
jgi:hypothetical protein